MPADLANDRQESRDRPYWIEITGQAAGTNRYAWSQVNDTDTAFPSMTGAFAMSGTSSASGWPAYEVTGRDDVPTGSQVVAHVSASGKFWTFRYDGPGAGGTAGRCTGGCGTLIGLLESWALSCEVLCNTGEFDSADFAADYDGTALSLAQFRNTAAGTWKLQYWNPDGAPAAWTDWLFDYGAAAAVPILTFDTDGAPILTINGHTMFLRCLGADATFTGGVRNGFVGSGTQPAVPCDPNDFTLRLACQCEWIDGWRGPGWYCVEDTGPTDCFAAELLDADRCDTSIVICSGPYASQAAAEAVCPPGITTACCTDPIPQTLNWTLSGLSGTCDPGAPASGTVTYNSGTGKWESVTFAYLLGECEEGATYDLECLAGVWTFQGTPTVTCPEDGPLSIAFTKTINGGTYTITFTA